MPACIRKRLAVLNPDPYETGAEMTDDTHTNEVPDAPHDSPVVLAHVIAEAVRDLAAGMPVHEHAWDILDVQEAPRPPVLLPMQATVTSTYVLLRCVSCGLPDALTLPG